MSSLDGFDFLQLFDVFIVWRSFYVQVRAVSRSRCFAMAVRRFDVDCGSSTFAVRGWIVG